MNDIFGTQIETGQTVAFITPAYRDLSLGTVIGFTPKNVKVKFSLKYTLRDVRLIEPHNLVVNPIKTVVDNFLELDKV